MNKTVTIIGAGWLGLPLGNKLAENGYSVIGTSQTGLNPLENNQLNRNLTDNPSFGPANTKSQNKPPKFPIFSLSLRDTLQRLKKTPYSEDNKQHFSKIFNSSQIIITLPFRRHFDPPTIYLSQINSLLGLIEKHSSKTSTIIFTSSTAIYPNRDKAWKESEIKTEAELLNYKNQPHAFLNPNRYERAQTLLACENTIQKFCQQHKQHCFILRLAGLVGPNRMPERFFRNKNTTQATQQRLMAGNQPINLVHQNDVLESIIKCLESDQSGIYNIVANEHPLKQEFYTKRALKTGNSPPLFTPSKSKGKLISNSKSAEKLNLVYTSLNDI